VGNAGRHEDRHSGAGGFGSVGIPKRQFAIQDVPGFIIGMMDMKCGRAAAAPLMIPNEAPEAEKRTGFMRPSYS
jgi:hypothetical protein